MNRNNRHRRRRAPPNLGDVLSNSDAWDDEALIHAWNASMHHYQEAHHPNHPIAAETHSAANDNDDNDDDDDNDDTTNGRASSSSPNKKRQLLSSEWEVGDECQALWQEDGEYYDAVIVQVIPEKNQLKVRFSEYEEELVVPRETVRRLRPSSPASSLSSAAASSSPSSLSSSPPSSSVPSSPSSFVHPNNSARESSAKSTPTSMPRKESHAGNGHQFPSYQPIASFHPYALPSFPYGGMHFMHPHPPPSSPFLPSYFPPYAAPPYSSLGQPPSELQLPKDEDLCNLLMAWYFSGYYAGLYQKKIISKSTTSTAGTRKSSKSQSRGTPTHHSHGKSRPSSSSSS